MATVLIKVAAFVAIIVAMTGIVLAMGAMS